MQLKPGHSPLRKIPASALLILAILAPGGAQGQTHRRAPMPATCSIVAWDSLTGDLAVAVESERLAAGSMVPYARAGVGAVATQGDVDADFGPRGLALLDRGMDPRQTVDQLLQTDSAASGRQIGVVDARGVPYSYTGTDCSPAAGQGMGPGYTVQGSGLESETIVTSVARMFEITGGDLADRMLAALEAGDRALRKRAAWRSAALLVVRDMGGAGGSSDRFVDIRVDDDSLPLVQLRRIYREWQEVYLPEARMQTIQEFNRKRNYRAADIELKRIADGFNEELRNKPGDPEVLARVARALATYEIDRDRALELAKRAVLLAPGRNDFMDTMAECHYHLGHYDEAIAIESDLVSKEPSNDIYWRQLQKFKEAKQKAGR